MTPANKELTRVVKTQPDGKVVQEFVEEPDRVPVDKSNVPNQNVAIATPESSVKEREVVAYDTFSTKQAEQASTYELSIEFQNETTGERRIVDLEEAMTEAEAFAKSSEYRQTGEVVLQVLRKRRVD